MCIRDRAHLHRVCGEQQIRTRGRRARLATKGLALGVGQPASGRRPSQRILPSAAFQLFDRAIYAALLTDLPCQGERSSLDLRVGSKPDGGANGLAIGSARIEGRRGDTEGMQPARPEGLVQGEWNWD